VTAEFAAAFRIAARAGLMPDPHGGELCGPDSVLACLDQLHARRIGHGITAARNPGLLARLADDGVTLEVCPSSNVSLGVFSRAAEVPLPRLLAAGVPVALGADDPLLFGSRLTAQYELAAGVFGLADAELAGLARMSVHGSVAPGAVRGRLLAGIDSWLARSPATAAACDGARDVVQRGRP
jgi:adenosine deaminase